jgi:hypothetical protein
MVKEIARDNLGADAAAGRTLAAYGLTVAANLGAGPSITKGFAYKNVLEEMQAIAESSRTSGTELYFSLEPSFGSDGLLNLTFTTKVDQWGQDRTEDSGAPVFFGKKWGNLSNAYYYEDRRDEVNYVLAAAWGEDASRVTDEVEDATRMAQSVWGRREGFADARNQKTEAGITAQANKLLAEGRPVKRFGGRILDSGEYRYGIDWDFGDMVTAEYRGKQFDATISTVHIRVDEFGQEHLDCRLEVEA